MNMRSPQTLEKFSDSESMMYSLVPAAVASADGCTAVTAEPEPAAAAALLLPLHSTQSPPLEMSLH
jgi:hypothetical protein